MKFSGVFLSVLALLSLASAATYRIRPGDTLSGIARSSNLSVNALLASNPRLKKSSVLQVGQRLQLPESTVRRGNGTAVVRSASIRMTGIWPVQGRITTPYSPNRGHAGVDIAALAGTPIRVPQTGRVLESYFDSRSGWGWTVAIDLGGGFVARYSHNRANLVRQGDWVQAGQVVARVGSTGNSTGPHVDYRLTYNGQAINPLGAG